MINKFDSFTNVNKTSKNKILIDNISKLNIGNINDVDIINIVCDYGLCPEAKPSYGEWNDFIIKDRSVEGMFQTPKQIADAILELLKYDIDTYAEVGVYKGGTYLLMTNILKLKNPDLQSIGIDISDRNLTEDIKKYINLHIGTSEDYKGTKYDLAFIDADHSYEGVLTDYQNIGKYAKIVMFHDINDNRCPGVVKFWNEVKKGKKYKEFTYQTDGENVHGIGLLFNDIVEDYPMVRHLSTYESTISMLENGFIMSRNELKNKNFNIDEIKGTNSKDKWWNERRYLESKKFGTEDLIYCTPDWYGDYGYETGHGSVMIYFKPTIFEKFKLTLTIEDSLTENRAKYYNSEEIKKIYSNILKENSYSNYKYESQKILENLNNKNAESLFNTSKGKIFIEGGRFYNKYSEIQIHAKKIPVSYIKEIKLTDNYFNTKESDSKNKNKLLYILNDNKIPII
jgi:hypothetical protein